MPAATGAVTGGGGLLARLTTISAKSFPALTKAAGAAAAVNISSGVAVRLIAAA